MEYENVRLSEEKIDFIIEMAKDKKYALGFDAKVVSKCDMLINYLDAVKQHIEMKKGPIQSMAKTCEKAGIDFIGFEL